MEYRERIQKILKDYYALCADDNLSNIIVRSIESRQKLIDQLDCLFLKLDNCEEKGDGKEAIMSKLSKLLYKNEQYLKGLQNSNSTHKQRMSDFNRRYVAFYETITDIMRKKPSREIFLELAVLKGQFEEGLNDIYLRESSDEAYNSRILWEERESLLRHHEDSLRQISRNISSDRG